MPLVTTIVPVYNVGKYLRACLDSLLEQGLREGEHEILLVDDGSTDGSGETCDEYAARYPSLIRVFHKSNGGVSSARNLGIRMARGEYVHFMDADDYMIAGGYAFLRDNFLAGGRRVDYLGFYSVTLDDVARRRFVEHNDPSGKVVFDGDVRLLYQGNKYLSLIVVGLYRRSVIADMEFDTEMRIGEDIKFNLDFALKNPGILLTDCSLYRYVIRPGSAIGNRCPRRMREAVAGYERLLTGAAAAVADYPAMTGGLETLIHCEMVPFTSRILSSDMTRSEFAALGRRLKDAGVMPLKVKFRFDTYVNLIFPPLCSFPFCAASIVTSFCHTYCRESAKDRNRINQRFMIRIVSLILMCTGVLSGAFRTVLYIVWLKIREGLDNPFKNIKQPNENMRAYVLGAGPSFNSFLQEYDEGKAIYSDVDYFASNFFVHDSHFTVLKPKYYSLSDGIFFCDSVYKDRGRAVMTALADNVTWPMILFVPRNYLKSDFLGILGNNGNIKVIGVHSISYQGLEKWRNWSYNKGWGNGEFGSVVLYSLYAALVIGYKRINMYGIDHTYFDNLAVDDDNRLCFKDSHYYGSDKNLKPLYMIRDNVKEEDLRTFTVSEYLENKLKLFRGHEIMARYARSIGADIVNCTPVSMVDAYRRLKNDEKPSTIGC